MRRWVESVDDEEEKVEAVYYVAPIGIVRDRLELSGYTLSTAKSAFATCMHAKAEQYSEYAAQGDEDFWKPQIALLNSLDADQWLSAMRRIGEADLAEPKSRHGPFDGTLVDYMLKHDWYGYSSIDLKVPLRLAIEICTESDNMVYDLTDLTSGGYYSAEDDFVALASSWTAAEHAATSKIIILTEGRSDRWIISESLKILYPHLFDYFTFMDFELARVEGGTGALAGMVKSFAGAGIANKVLAIFDNDTAGESAIRTLNQISLPTNIRIMRLPIFEALCDYPTIGPSGMTTMDVNGMAASIELYLGADTLSEDGKLSPVQWTGYDTACKKYQGEVLNKKRIHERFKEKLRLSGESMERTNNDGNWDGMRKVLMCIFSAFHTFDREMIFSELKEDYEGY